MAVHAQVWRYHGWLRLCCVLLVVPGLIPCGGCIGLVANLIHAGLGNLVPAKYEGLKERRVAVVCVSKSALFGPSTAAQEIAHRVEKRLQDQVKGIQIIGQQKISDWIDREGWDEMDYRELGVGVDAQTVVGIDIISFSLREGHTLYKGRSDLEVRVFDMDQAGKVVFQEILPQVQYPVIAGQYITDTNETQFRQRFLDVIAERIGQIFYAREVAQDFGRDSTSVDF